MRPEEDSENTGQLKPPRATLEEIADEEDEIKLPLKLPAKVGASQYNIGGGLGKTALVSLLVSILVFLMMGMLGGGSFVTKTDFETNLANMNVTFDQSKAELVKIQGTLNNAIQNLPNTISSQVSNAIGTHITQLENQLSAVSGELTSTNSRIEALEVRIASIEAELEEEEEKEEAILADEDDILEVGLKFTNTFEFEAGKTLVEEQPLQIQVKNVSDFDVENVEIEVVVHSNGTPVRLSNSLCEVNGWPLQWAKIYVASGVIVIKGTTPTYSGSLDIDSNRDEDINIILTLGVKPEDVLEDDVSFYIEAKVSAFDLKE